MKMKMKLKMKLLFFTVSCWMFVESESADLIQKNIPAVEGETVTLTCEATNDEKIRVVLWSRPDLKDQLVFLFRDGHIDPHNHPSYENRVDLKDRTMKNGDVSLILKNVTFSDRGIFECYIKQGGINSPMKPISSISLSVLPPGGAEERREDGGREDGGREDGGREDGGREDGGREDGGRGPVGLIVGLPLSALVVVLLVVVMIHRQKMKMKSPPLPPAGSDPDQDKPLSQFDSERLTEVC